MIKDIIIYFFVVLFVYAVIESLKWWWQSLKTIHYYELKGRQCEMKDKNNIK